jgi:hypothetical protein
MKIIIPIDDRNSGKCGVTDYTLALVNNLRSRAVDVSTPRVLSASDILALKCDKKILHIQYPSLDSRFSLLPQMLSLLSHKSVLTLHETGSLNKIRRQSLRFFRSSATIVTNEFDFKYVHNILRHTVVKKIELAAPFSINPSTLRCPTGNLKVCYFGLVRPDKNLADVARLAMLLSVKRPDVEFHVVCGLPRPLNAKEFGSFKSLFPTSCTWHIGTPTEALPALLSGFDMAFLPFPNGADENRSSLLSVIAARLVPIIYASDRTPEFMRKLFFVCSSPETALPFIPFEREFLTPYMSKIDSLKDIYHWDNVVNMHVELYSHLLGGKTQSTTES